jgi:hypothetical protein
MDFVLALLPFFLVWHLKMGNREKVGLVVAMSLGVLSVPLSRIPRASQPIAA